MNNIIIHIGTPRTGTTVIQKSLLPITKNYITFQKRAYTSSGEAISKSKSYLAGSNPTNLLTDIERINPLSDTTLYFNRFIANPAILAAHNPTIDNAEKIFFPILKKAIERISETSSKENKSIVISSERLCETSSSFVCRSKHSKHDWVFNYIPVCAAISQVIRTNPLISVCLREPITYLRSKYLRTCIQRQRMRGERYISPSEYIKKQSILETNHPGTSALSPAMHSEFIKQLQHHSFVKAFGFQDLLSSDDVFSLMGLQGEEAYSFRSFPRENKIFTTNELENAIENQIIKALKKHGFYERIMKAKMFE